VCGLLALLHPIGVGSESAGRVAARRVVGRGWLIGVDGLVSRALLALEGELLWLCVGCSRCCARSVYGARERAGWRRALSRACFVPVLW
jgi:hypothetical protein